VRKNDVLRIEGRLERSFEGRWTHLSPEPTQFGTSGTVLLVDDGRAKKGTPGPKKASSIPLFSGEGFIDREESRFVSPKGSLRTQRASLRSGERKCCGTKGGK